ncbi:MAG: hypothetical protein MR332_13790 [Fusicatenibacter sp.]|nr:hypothetical protein [Fusicatenibacter sp.]
MAKIGEYRFKIYELLYRKPVCKYAETSGKKKEQNVLLLGNSWVGNEEVDVIALKGMNAIMISCKTTENDSIQWLYEIKSIADHFLSTGVIAVSSDYSSKNRSIFRERAKQMNIPLWGMETLWDRDRLREALGDVIKQSD